MKISIVKFNLQLMQFPDKYIINEKLRVGCQLHVINYPNIKEKTDY